MDSILLLFKRSKCELILSKTSVDSHICVDIIFLWYIRQCSNEEIKKGLQREWLRHALQAVRISICGVMSTFVYCSQVFPTSVSPSVISYSFHTIPSRQTAKISYGKCDSGISGMNLDVIYVVSVFVLKLKRLCSTQMERVLYHFPQVLYA